MPGILKLGHETSLELLAAVWISFNLTFRIMIVVYQLNAI